MATTKHDQHCRFHASRSRVRGTAAFDADRYDAKDACFSAREAATSFIFTGGRKRGERADWVYESPSVNGGLFLNGRFLGVVRERRASGGEG